PAPAPTEIYTLSLHDALPIWRRRDGGGARGRPAGRGTGDRCRSAAPCATEAAVYVACSTLCFGTVPLAQALRTIGELQFTKVDIDRKSTRLNSSHLVISYAVF